MNLNNLPEGIRGLLRGLPPDGEPFPRKALFLKAFAAMIEVYYPEPQLLFQSTVIEDAMGLSVPPPEPER